MNGGPTRSIQPAKPEDRLLVAELWTRYGLAIRRFFSRRLHGDAELDDLTQEVFARLLKRAELGDIDNAEGYLFHIAANLLRERARQQVRRHGDANHAPIDESEEFSGEDFSPERILLGREACAMMIEALQELPERARTIFILNRFEELSGTEIARRLGISVSAVEKNMMRAIAHLRNRLR